MIFLIFPEIPKYSKSSEETFHAGHLLSYKNQIGNQIATCAWQFKKGPFHLARIFAVATDLTISYNQYKYDPGHLATTNSLLAKKDCHRQQQLASMCINFSILNIKFNVWYI